MSAVESTAADITAGAWVRFGTGEHWRYVRAARHTPFSTSEPRTTGFVQYDAASWPERACSFYGFATHSLPCRIVAITPQAVAA